MRLLGGLPKAGISTPFLRHSKAPTKPNNSRNETMLGCSEGGPQACKHAPCTSGARRKGIR